MASKMSSKTAFSDSNWTVVLTLSVIVLALLHTVWRLWYGVDFGDEAWYVVLGYRFSLGARPLVDEHNVAQTMGMLIAPFVGAYVKFKGSLEGVVLFTRFLYMGMALLVSGYLYSFLKRIFGFWISASVASLYFVFFPLFIPNISYYSISLAFFTLGMCVSAFQIRPALSGALHAIAGVAYPPMLPVFFLYGLRLGIPFKTHFKMCLQYLGAMILVGGGIALIWGITPSTVLDYYNELIKFSGAHREVQEPMRIPIVLRDFFLYLYRSGFFVVFPAFLFSIRKINSFNVRSSVLLSVLAWITVINRPSWGGYGTTGMIIYLTIFAPFLAFDADENIKKLIRAIWLPSAIVGACMCIVSLNGPISGAIGWFPAFLIGVALFIKALCKDGKPTLFSKVAALSLIAVFVFYQRSVYNEGNVGELTEKTESGPFKGLYTSSIKHGFMVNLQKDLAPYHEKYSKILVVPPLQASYLLFPAQPVADSTWATCAFPEPKECFESLRDRFGNDMLILLLNYRPIKARDFNTYIDQTHSVLYDLANNNPPLLSRKEYILLDGFKSK